MAAGALRLLDELPETVYRVCDLIIVVTNRNGDKWRDNMLVCLVNEVCLWNSSLHTLCEFVLVVGTQSDSCLGMVCQCAQLDNPTTDSCYVGDQ